MKTITKRQQAEIDRRIKDKLFEAFKLGQNNPEGLDDCAKIILEQIFNAK